MYEDVPDRDVAAGSLARLVSAPAFTLDLPVDFVAPMLIGGSGEGDPFRAPVSRDVDHFGGHMIASAPARIELAADERARLALALYREGVSASSPYLGFMAFWGVLDAVLETRDAVDNFINGEAATSAGGVGLGDYAAERMLSEAGEDVATYLREHSRNAVAHVLRDREDMPHINPDDPNARARLAAEGYWLRGIGRRAILRRWPVPVTPIAR